MADLLAQYEEYLATEKHASQNTLSSYMRDLHQFAVYLDEFHPMPLPQVTQEVISGYVAWMGGKGKSAATITRSIASIKSLYTYLQMTGEVSANPAKGVAAVKVEHKFPEILTGKEVELFLEQPQCVDAKGSRDHALLEQLNVHPAAYIADTKNPSYHPGRCADIIIDGKKLGVIGQIHPLVAEGYGIDGEVYVAELDFTGLQAALAPERVFHSLPKFPTVSRDLALVCDEAMTVGMLEACIKKAGGKLLRSIQLFDIYRGPGIAPGKKSVAFSLELRADDRTLTDEDTTGVTNSVLEKLKIDLGVTLR